ncbi:hypothetical protein AVEN_153212-1, partial [Araneus ventricosus]
MGITEACKYHKGILQLEEYKEEDMANSAINPPYRAVQHWLTAKINTGIETPVGENLNKEVKLGDLCELRCQLIEKINDLKELDLQVEKVVNISEIEKEVTDSEKYRETGIVLKSRLDRCTSSLERTSNILQTNQN